MPCLTIFTNLSESQIPKNFISKITPVLVEGVRKPAEKFMFIMKNDCLISINGDSIKPGIIATLESIGNLGPDENDIIAKKLTTFFENELGVESSRFSLKFYDLEKHNEAICGSTIRIP